MPVGLETYGLGPVRPRVASIRRCTRSWTIVVSTVQPPPNGVGTKILTRGMDVVRVAGWELAGGAVLFEDVSTSPRTCPAVEGGSAPLPATGSEAC